MNKLILLLILSIFLLDYLGIGLAVIPREFTWLPEFISLIAIGVVALSIGGQSVALDKKYLILFIAFLIHIFIGIVINTVPEGAIIAGLRTYLKFFPIFLIPVIYNFNEKQIRLQIRLLVVLLIIQTPLALYQRFVQFKGVQSGDAISGTLNISSMLTVAMVTAITIVVAFYLKKRISLKKAIVLITIFFIPTTLNETKSTIIFFPLALIAPVFLFKGTKKKIRTTIVLAIVIGAGLVTFVNIYDHLLPSRFGGKGLTEFMTSGQELGHFLYRGVKADDKAEHIGRIDSYALALSVLSEEKLKLIFGVGIGNVSGSYIAGLEGEYTKYGGLGAGTTSLAYLLWELGVLGVIIHFVFFYFIFQDSRKLSKSDSYLGALSLGFASVMIIVVISVGYKNFLYTNYMGYMLWYFAGLISSTNIRMKRSYNASPRSDKVPANTTLYKKPKQLLR